MTIVHSNLEDYSNLVKSWLKENVPPQDTTFGLEILSGEQREDIKALTGVLSVMPMQKVAKACHKSLKL